MNVDYYMIVNGVGFPLAGPIRSEPAARMWIAFNRHRYVGPLSMVLLTTEWRPIATYLRVEEVPRLVWEGQAHGDLIVVRTEEGQVAIFA